MSKSPEVTEWVALKGEHDGATFEVMTGGAIKIEVGGSVHVRTAREWHALAVQSFASETPGKSDGIHDREFVDPDSGTHYRESDFPSAPSAAAAPSGWLLIPAEPTKEMIDRMEGIGGPGQQDEPSPTGISWQEWQRRRWHWILAVAPKAPPSSARLTGPHEPPLMYDPQQGKMVAPGADLVRQLRSLYDKTSDAYDGDYPAKVNAGLVAVYAYGRRRASAAPAERRKGHTALRVRDGELEVFDPNPPSEACLSALKAWQEEIAKLPILPPTADEGFRVGWHKALQSATADTTEQRQRELDTQADPGAYIHQPALDPMELHRLLEPFAIAALESRDAWRKRDGAMYELGVPDDADALLDDVLTQGQLNKLEALYEQLDAALRRPDSRGEG